MCGACRYGWSKGICKGAGCSWRRFHEAVGYYVLEWAVAGSKIQHQWGVISCVQHLTVSQWQTSLYLLLQWNQIRHFSELHAWASWYGGGCPVGALRYKMSIEQYLWYKTSHQKWYVEKISVRSGISIVYSTFVLLCIIWGGRPFRWCIHNSGCLGVFIEVLVLIWMVNVMAMMHFVLVKQYIVLLGCRKSCGHIFHSQRWLMVCLALPRHSLVLQ